MGLAGLWWARRKGSIWLVILLQLWGVFKVKAEQQKIRFVVDRLASEAQ